MRWPRSASSPRRPSRISSCSTPTTRAPPRPPRVRTAPVYWFSLGASGAARARGSKNGRDRLSRRRRTRRRRRIMPLSGIPLKGEHNVENVLAAVCAARLAGAPGRGDPPRHRELPGRRASPRIRRHRQRRRVLQRLQSHQRRRHRQGRRRISIAAFTSSSAARTRTPTTPCSLRLLRPARARRLHHRLGGGKNRVAPARRGSAPLLRDPGQGRHRRCRPRPIPATWCCWRRPAPASTSLKATNIAAASSRSSSTRCARLEGMAKRVGVDKWIFFTTLLLVVVGLAMVFSASAVVAQEPLPLALSSMWLARQPGRSPACSP